jgi:electron transfer flavoprotein alpha subunit
LAGGLGLGSKAAFERLQYLGTLLDAAVVGTRAAVACGWTSEQNLLTRHVATIRPRLYVAFGVVGEYDHLKAIEDAQTLVAVTEDADAPIAAMADFVAIGDPALVLEEVIQRVEAARKETVRVSTPAAS